MTPEAAWRSNPQRHIRNYPSSPSFLGFLSRPPFTDAPPVAARARHCATEHVQWSVPPGRRFVRAFPPMGPSYVAAGRTCASVARRPRLRRSRTLRTLRGDPTGEGHPSTVHPRPTPQPPPTTVAKLPRGGAGWRRGGVTLRRLLQDASVSPASRSLGRVTVPRWRAPVRRRASGRRAGPRGAACRSRRGCTE